ncbi:hypothetical protein Tco_1363147 [Tanacetum coccineum]
MGVIMELHEVGCYWPATREVTGEDGGDDEEGDREGETKGLGALRISTATCAKVNGKSIKHNGWVNKTSDREGSTLGWGNKTKEPFRCMSTPSASFNTCRPSTTLSHTSRLIRFLGSKPTTLLMAIKDTYLLATHTAPTLFRTAPLDPFCFILVLLSSIIIQTIVVIFDEKKLESS